MIEIIKNNKEEVIKTDNYDLSSIIKKYEIVRTENIRENNLILTIPLDDVKINISKNNIT